MFIEMAYTCNVTKENTPRLEESITIITCPYEAAKGSHAIAILTEWGEFKNYDYSRIYESMAKPAFKFDGRNILDHDALRELGFEVKKIRPC